eukprot:TRINITY_DN4916_c1_g1_i1.p1 TRINITY_DN4916_c1_g1~~TRINITY_DN4916_c1_g1_i1.p1  ORF type:complete len:347 (-),score=45.74 TRINITY_DN4916_c1_g1_i1:148-1188(-)
MVKALLVLLCFCTAGAIFAHFDVYQNPVLVGNFPDPGAININGTFFVATSEFPFTIHKSSDLITWTKAGSIFGSGGAPTWAKVDYWAPEIHAVGDGFVAFFTARHKNGQLSIGAAVGYSVLGPFQDIGKPLLQDENPKYMFLDSTFFHDQSTGFNYIIWKRGTITPPEETHTLLYMQKLSASGTEVLGDRQVILENNLTSWELGVVEAPWLVKPPGQPFFYLFYSGAHCCDESGSYSVGVARATAASGPYQKSASGPILRKNAAFAGPGHCSVLPLGYNSSNWLVVYHAFVGNASASGDRVLMQDVLRFDGDGGWPRMVGGTESPSVGPMELPPLPFELLMEWSID